MLRQIWKTKYLRMFLAIWLTAFLSSCATESAISNKMIELPRGTERLYQNSQNALMACQENDAEAWAKLACIAKDKENVWGLASSRRLFGDLTNAALSGTAKQCTCLVIN